MSQTFDIPNLGTIIPELGIWVRALASSGKQSATGKSTQQRGSSLADALFTSTQQKVLGLLFGQPDRSFFVTEIMALVNSGRGAVQRELARLETGGLINVSKVGNQKHFQANDESPLFDELCGIVRKTVGLAEPLKAAVDSLPGEVALALIYGSIARKADSSASDVDLMIVADDVTLEDVFVAMAPAEQRLDRQISPTLYSQQEFSRRLEDKNAFLMRVLSGPNIILVGQIDGERQA